MNALCGAHAAGLPGEVLPLSPILKDGSSLLTGRACYCGVRVGVSGDQSSSHPTQ